MASDLRLEEVEKEFGHPGDLWEALRAAVQANATTRFAGVQDDWLNLMWSLDGYRVAGVAPRGMGRATLGDARRLGGVYREKGNWFATLLALLVQNQTSHQIKPRTKVNGFSQMHQIDLAWPVRQEDPLVCAETKVTGAPAYDSTPVRGALSDFTNRRKELKFAATDLKLFRRQQDTSINHWGVWRENAPPKTYFLWAARLREDVGRRRGEDIGSLVREAQALVNTYLDGAGLIAWRRRPNGPGYEAVQHPSNAQVTTLDDVLYRIASEIKRVVQREHRVPPPQTPTRRAVDTESLAADEFDAGSGP